MIDLTFGGWFQCRLATDPDPYDEPRGVSGYVHAYVGEPDLDRAIEFQAPGFVRPLNEGGITVGVDIVRVDRDGLAQPHHPLLGAQVRLLGPAKFEGRNGVIADDGLEPIWPFELELAKQDFRLGRSVVPADPAYPYADLLAGGVEGARDEIIEATGISDLAGRWRNRLAWLTAQAGDLPEPQHSGTLERIAFLDRQLRSPGNGAARFFFARMRYDYLLSSVTHLTDPLGWLPEAAASTAAWPVRFWLGGWDADLLCGYAKGTITIPEAPPPAGPPNRVLRATDRRP